MDGVCKKLAEADAEFRLRAMVSHAPGACLRELFCKMQLMSGAFKWFVFAAIVLVVPSLKTTPKRLRISPMLLHTGF